MKRLMPLLAVVLAGACAQITVPPVSSTPTGENLTGKFVWFDLVTEDVAAIERFYGGLFDWTFERLSEDESYTLIRHNGKPVGGIVFSDQLNAVSEARWVSYLSVPDVDASARLVRERGGEVHFDPRDVPNRGRIAVVSDPQGAVIALVHASGGDPADGDLETGEWMWNELWTTDTDRAFAFYEELVGYERRSFGEVEGEPYQLMRRDDRFRAGMVRLPWSGVKPNWLPYVLVEDPSVTASKVEGLGGRVILSPEGVLHGGVAIILDPSGAAFGVQRRPSREAPAE